MKKTFCDICGREVSGFVIKSELFIPWYEKDGFVSQTRKDVCGRCQEKLANYILIMNDENERD